MTITELRNRIATRAERYAEAGTVYRGSVELNRLIKIYNDHRPLARNIMYTYSLGGWCELGADVLFIEEGIADAIYPEIGPWEAMQNAKVSGIWEDPKDYQPERGDKIYYKYEAIENGKKRVWYHVGIVTNADKSDVYTTEFNVQDRVLMLKHSLLDDTIEGYIRPNYQRYATTSDPADEIKNTGTYTMTRDGEKIVITLA